MDTSVASPRAALAHPGRRHPWLGLLGWLLLCYGAAAIGAFASRGADQFYALLERPVWAPPAVVFGPVWTVLYALMAVAAWQVWCARGWRRGAGPLALFVLQLGLNALWSWLFFGWQRGGWALADIVLLCLLLAGLVAAFWRIRRSAGLLLLPYLAWVGFACVLNWSVWQRNPQWL